jgi:hypothetical protein
VIDPSEAEIVRSIFERYLVLESLPELQRELRESGTLTRRELATGKAIGGVALATASLRRSKTFSMECCFGLGGDRFVSRGSRWLLVMRDARSHFIA